MATPAKPEDWAVVEGSYLLPLDDAVDLMRLLSRAQRVERNWGGNSSAAPFKAASASQELTLLALTIGQYAAVQLSVE